VHDAVKEPLKITLAVLLVGFAFRAVRHKIKAFVTGLTGRLGYKTAIFLIVLSLGLVSSFITAIISALILAEIITVLGLERKCEIRIVIYACFAIGLGAALTPLGEPLSTIAVAKLKGPPHNATFFYLLKLLGLWVVPGVFVCAAASAYKIRKSVDARNTLREDKKEDIRAIMTRAVKVYFFVMALVLLGAGLSTFAERMVAHMPTWGLYWLNSVSAIVDNATLAAAEIVPAMTEAQIIFLLMGLLISGGMLIPGNIPNIISASKLGIRSREWAAVAVPAGTLMMVVYFVLMMLVY